MGGYRGHSGTYRALSISMNTSKIVAFLNRHDVGFGSATVESFTDKTITVRTVEYHADGTECEVTEVIPATIEAARDWLGY